ncbi:hypothetical protein [Nocardia brasiliensis]|uniref:hypothetical protein n=1 Tax=Nocardia brasiliensis TaxID=37326 RepID=UPI00366BD69D
MSKFLDPDGERHGLPTWPWGLAPQHLRTWRQLDAENKRPVGEYEGQVRGAGWRQAYLYDSREVRPKRKPSAAQLESLKLARWTRSVDACERRGIDARDMREVIETARAQITAHRQSKRGQGRERSR